MHIAMRTNMNGPATRITKVCNAFSPPDHNRTAATAPVAPTAAAVVTPPEMPPDNAPAPLPTVTPAAPEPSAADSVGAEQRTRAEQRRLERLVDPVVVLEVVALEAFDFSTGAQNHRHALVQIGGRDVDVRGAGAVFDPSQDTVEYLVGEFGDEGT